MELFKDVTNMDLLFTILSIYGIYLKTIILLLILFSVLYRYYRIKTTVVVHYQRKSNLIFAFILLYIFVDIVESHALYRYTKMLTKEYDSVHMKMYHDYNTKIENEKIIIDKTVSKLYDDFKIQPKNDTINYDNKGRFK